MALKGLFGGSFNPPTRAHRALAAAAIEQLALDELVVVPAGRPWQKTGLAAAEHRVAMTELALHGLRCVVSRVEVDREGPSYSIDTLTALQQQGDAADAWFLVIGQDQYAQLSSWHRVDELLARCTLAVAARGEPVCADPALPAHRLHTIQLPADPVSASQVRALLARGEPVTPLVGEEVAGYIAHHNLYGP